VGLCRVLFAPPHGFYVSTYKLGIPTHSSLRSFPASLAAGSLDVLDSLVGTLAGTTLLVLGSLGLLGLHLLCLTVLDLLGGSVGVLVAVLAGFSLLSTDLLDGHANDGLLDAGRLAGTLRLNIVNFNLLVMGSPGQVPGKLDGLDLLVEQAASLGGDEVVGLAIFRNKADAAARHDSVLREGTPVGFSNHF